MRRIAWVGVVIVAAVAAGGAVMGSGPKKDGPAPDKKADAKQPDPTTQQLLMRDKLTHAKDALDGLTVEDYGKVANSARMLRMISRAASWYVLDSEEYTRHSKNFQEQAADLERHARAKNLDAASLDYMRISMTCIQCHKYVREARPKKP